MGRLSIPANIGKIVIERDQKATFGAHGSPKRVVVCTAEILLVDVFDIVTARLKERFVVPREVLVDLDVHDPVR
jgi:hypothetical protein